MNPGDQAITGTIEEQCRQFGSILGLNRPVSEQVLRAAVHDPNYAHNLLAARRSEMFLNHLLNNPPRVDMGNTAASPGSANVPAAHSNTELAVKAGQALWKWAKAGFSTVDDEVYRRRITACMACPHSQSKPDKLLYKAMSAASSASANSAGIAEKICGKCGCVLSKKTRLPTESCPDNHPVLAGLTRWGEPIPVQ
ncbi:hypothetical protein [Paenibacillus kobensis]|uniref:hypothetical protein n=1 Tax=Paenibacillus kobensis TaxID=59841 RepID=UPI000FD72544|nr:hypothetical protein [Paenibacillus kobensis]